MMQQLSIFRKKVDKKHDKRDVTLHILFIKCEGQKLPRNNGAYELEAYCGTHFYGPIIAAYNKTVAPHSLMSFTEEDLNDRIGKINENENKGSTMPQVNQKSEVIIRKLRKVKDFNRDLRVGEKRMS